MGNDNSIRIDVEAAKALAQWKALFAEEVCHHAKQLAGESIRPNRVTLAHFRQAAQLALISLSAVIQNEGVPDANSRAA